MEFSLEQGIINEEAYYVDLKSEIEEFLKLISTHSMIDFKKEITDMFSSLQASFSNLSNNQRHVSEQQDKLRRNVRNKNEILKSIEDDQERQSNLKAEFDNILVRLDNSKNEENDKDKEIRQLNEDIIKLRAKLDQENIQNYKPQELEDKMKKIAEHEDWENRVVIINEKREQQFQIQKKLHEEKFKTDQYGQELDKINNHELKTIAELEDKLKDIREEKIKFEEQFQQKKVENTKLKEDIVKFEETIDQKKEEQRNTKESIDKAEVLKKHMTTNLNHLRTKTIVDHKLKIKEMVKKSGEQSEIIKEFDRFIKEKDKEINDFHRENNQTTNQKREKQKEHEAKRNEINEVMHANSLIKKEITLIENEIKMKKYGLINKRNELQKSNKYNDDFKHSLEQLTQAISEIHNSNNALENVNHRAVNETNAIKKETLELEVSRDNIEKEKNLYAKHASDANMEHTQALERLKNLNETINDLKAKNASAETKLKQQKKIYEALKADCNRFAKKYQDAQLEIKETNDEKHKKTSKYNYLKLELAYKQKIFSETITSVTE